MRRRETTPGDLDRCLHDRLGVELAQCLDVGADTEILEHRVALARAASCVCASSSAPLIADALRMRPCADGMPSRQVTLLPPPDSPKIVTF